MLENIYDGALLLFTFYSIAALVIGVIIGVFIGAIPGMSTVMAVAIVLPFTFTLPPVPAILLLLGVYKGGLYGGSISAILINTPGTPSASCTMIDGYPLAKKGKARRALEMALYASCFGDVISNIFLIALAAWLASFALDFGAPELFTLVVFSLTIVASVAGDKISKGMLSAGLGLLLATVGTDLIIGSTRFVFDVTELRSGISLVPVLIGLFALPEVLKIYFNNTDNSREAIKLDNEHIKLSDMRSMLKTLFRSSFIGVFLGIIPGLGATPAAFLAYSEARRNSKDPDSFGKGNLEGVAASEAGNSGVAGSTMIPLLALGIPGDVITAVVLGAFMIHGLQPGPLMFQNNIELIYAVFMGIMIGSIVLFFVGRAAIPILGRLVSMRSSLLFPAVLVLCVYGSYAVNNSLLDVAVMFIMGIVGIVFVKATIPLAPLLIAFVLGPLLENNFRQGMLMGQGDFTIFFSGPITWVFWTLTAVSLFSTIRGNYRKRKIWEKQLAS
ncbi:tripartite tricarboxylate transporter permease [Oceanisphaera sp. IT1-181]|uniref:tripartite tricarboxylate transporter permease n=1 Tax=Oceanisphaera sp. IT1-181 TaxID=3081199 RepID=UPI0029CA5F4E|nr:tripartite tricarboxylate transporter permease [Oceanisphaera sp. IT1-181]